MFSLFFPHYKDVPDNENTLAARAGHLKQKFSAQDISRTTFQVLGSCLSFQHRTWFLSWNIQNELDLFPLATQTLPIAWYFYQNFQFSTNIINKIMFMSVIFIEELWKSIISYDFTAII